MKLDQPVVKMLVTLIEFARLGKLPRLDGFDLPQRGCDRIKFERESAGIDAPLRTLPADYLEGQEVYLRNG